MSVYCVWIDIKGCTYVNDVEQCMWALRCCVLHVCVCVREQCMYVCMISCRYMCLAPGLNMDAMLLYTCSCPIGDPLPQPAVCALSCRRRGRNLTRATDFKCNPRSTT
jgi:hypothetical protein